MNHIGGYNLVAPQYQAPSYKAGSAGRTLMPAPDAASVLGVGGAPKKQWSQTTGTALTVSSGEPRGSAMYGALASGEPPPRMLPPSSSGAAHSNLQVQKEGTWSFAE